MIVIEVAAGCVGGVLETLGFRGRMEVNSTVTS